MQIIQARAFRIQTLLFVLGRGNNLFPGIFPENKLVGLGLQAGSLDGKFLLLMVEHRL